MPIRRPRGPKPALRHLAFLEAMSAAPESSPEHREARACFLALRHLDSWIALGADGGAPTDRSSSAVAEALAAVGEDTEMRSALAAITTAIPVLSNADAQPVLPRVFALGSLLESRGRMRHAADVYGTVARHVDTGAHADLAYDAHMRMASCLRHDGQLDLADQAYTTAGTLAARSRDRVRVLTSRVGRAKVMWVRGNYPAADGALRGLEAEARAEHASELVAMILHDRAVLSRMRGDLHEAIRLVWAGYQLTRDEFDRERMLWDLANFLGLSGAFDTAQDALRLIELSARHQFGRWMAQVNLMDLAARTDNELQFHHYRRALEPAPLAGARRVAYLLDAGRGLAHFGDAAGARTQLTEGLRLAESLHLNDKVFEFEAALAALAEQATTPTPAVVERLVPPEEIRTGLRERLLEVAGASS